MQQVFSAQVADGVSEIAKTIGAPFNAHVYLSGDLGGGTVTVEAEAPDGTFLPLDGVSITAAGVHTVPAMPRRVRLRLTGSTTPNLAAWVHFR